MTAIAILAATTALLGWLLYRQHGKTRAAVQQLTEALDDFLQQGRALIAAENERDEAQAAARVASSLAYKSAVAAEKAERQLERATSTAVENIVDLASRSLPAAPFRTADPDVAAKPFRGKFVPPCGDEGVLGLAVVTPIKRRRS